MPKQSNIIAPSILSADFSKLGEEVREVLSAGAEWIHFDVMDNHFVPNLTIGPMVCQSLRKSGIDCPLDVHLMVEPVDDLIKMFADAGANSITFKPYLEELYMVLLMSVFPGFGGQEFIPETISKIASLRRIIDEKQQDIRLEVDGGIKESNIFDVASAGADTFVAGSAIFNKSSYVDAIKDLRDNFN